MTSLAEQVAEEARRAVNEAVSSSFTRMQFKVERFERHRDGYLHARVVVGEQAHYFHRRYGSWLAPGHVGGKAVLKEPEALLGSEIGRELKFKLSELSRPYDQHARQERAQREERERRASRDSQPAQGRRGNDEDDRDPGVRAGPDRRDVDDEIQPDGE